LSLDRPRTTPSLPLEVLDLLPGNYRISLPVPVPVQEPARRGRLYRQGPPASLCGLRQVQGTGLYQGADRVLTRAGNRITAIPTRSVSEGRTAPRSHFGLVCWQTVA